MKSQKFATSVTRGLGVVALSLAAATASADVSVLEGNKTLTVDCAKDKNVNLFGNNLNVTLAGTCAQVVVGGNNIEARGSAAKFVIGGNNNKFAIGGADEIYVPGNNNIISWQTGVTRNEPSIAAPRPT